MSQEKPRSGKHKNPRRPLSQTPEQWEEQDRIAKAHGMTWTDFARACLQQAVDRLDN